MTIKILIGQRKCDYAGQYAPEVLAAIDENGDDANPEYIEVEYNANFASGKFSGLKVFNVKVKDSVIGYELAKAHVIDIDGLIE